MRTIRYAVIIALALPVILTACSGIGMRGAKPPDATRPQAGSSAQPFGSNAGTPRMQAGADGVVIFSADGSAGVPIMERDGKQYVAAKQLFDTLPIHFDWNAESRKLRIGDNDAVYEVAIDRRDASKAGTNVMLAEAPAMFDGTSYLPVSVLHDLLRDEISFTVKDGQLALHPTSKRTVMDRDATTTVQQADGVLSFAEDPADPYKAAIESRQAGNARKQAKRSKPAKTTASLFRPEALLHSDGDSMPAAASGDNASTIADLVDHAKRYVGVKYEFGAAPYPQSGTFDCSSFTQYVFGKYGIDLPRTARQQAQLGTSVSRKDLRVGDLLFFNIPGRFRNNTTVGHVGIYVGDMKMIDADTKPQNGVQITDLNKPFWQENFLSARRLIP